uniref:Uncharacterized protein n=1 Tax=Arundo donax TaxID=35708 RepID=A0A0A9GTI6_ARUDO
MQTRKLQCLQRSVLLLHCLQMKILRYRCRMLLLFFR